ncbi:MAG: endonuclease/exonuclease/phosphatase family protein [Proteobacteria bacterium]|nr:endonuclease/exonuclease/phosphatase family protein [Pseudomonadota bacterium]
MLAWAKRGTSAGERFETVAPVVNLRSVRAPTEVTLAPLKLLTFNIQVGIKTTKYRQYVTKGWKHVLPNGSRANNLRRIADLVADYDLVALQEIDAGSLRSGFVNQVEYLADRAQFPYWYAQLNRDLGPLAQHGNGVLSRVRPTGIEDHKLPGAIPGRGAIFLRVPYAGVEVLLVLLHLSLGGRSRLAQLEYVREQIAGEKHVVVMGDMNTPHKGLMAGSPLADIDLQPALPAQATYPAWRPELSLDHILASPTLQIDDAQVLNCRLSDHLPLAVTLTLA